MTDDYLDLNSKSEDDQRSAAKEEPPSWGIGRWAHVIAGGVFCLLYFPFEDHSWSWQVAITLSYIVFTLCCTCGLAFRDADDFLGNLEVPRFVATLLVRQTLVLSMVSLGAWLWHYLIPRLPSWAAHYSKVPPWMLLGIVLAYIVAVREASWMAAKIKERFPELDDPI